MKTLTAACFIAAILGAGMLVGYSRDTAAATTTTQQLQEWHRVEPKRKKPTYAQLQAMYEKAIGDLHYADEVIGQTRAELATVQRQLRELQNDYVVLAGRAETLREQLADCLARP